MSHRNAARIQVPPNLQDPLVLRRFLTALLERIDVVFGYRGDAGYVATNQLNATSDSLLAELAQSNSQLAAAITAAANQAYEDSIAYAQANFTNNPEQPAIADLSYSAVTRSGTYVQAEAQQVADDLATVAAKVDAILVALRNAEVIST